jgi:hypothetical protein
MKMLAAREHRRPTTEHDTMESTREVAINLCETKHLRRRRQLAYALTYVTADHA